MWTYDKPVKPGFYAVKNSSEIDGEIEIIRFYPSTQNAIIDRDGDTPDQFGEGCQWAEGLTYLLAIGGNQ